MALLVVPDLNDQDIVCQQPCNHRECREVRKTWAGAKCLVCGKDLIPGQAFTWNKEGKPEHAYHSKLAAMNAERGMT